MIVWNKEEHNDIPKSIEEMKEAKKNLDRVGLEAFKQSLIRGTA